MASDMGLDDLTHPRHLERSKWDSIVAGYEGERVVLLAAGDLPRLAAKGDVMNNPLQRIGMNVQGATEQGRLSIFCTEWFGLALPHVSSHPGATSRPSQE